MTLVFGRKALLSVAFLASATFAGAALAEKIATVPVSFPKIQTSENDGNDLVLHDKSTNLDWRFPTGDTGFYRLLGSLDGTQAGNLAGFAYVGNPPADEAGTDHAAWLAPLSADNQPSAYSGNAKSHGAQVFDAHALNVRNTADKGYALTDGSVTVASVKAGGDPGSLNLLKEMIEKYGLNTAWQMPSTEDRALTPVGTGGPVVVFLRTGEERTQASGMTGSTAKKNCHWWSFCM